MNMIASCKRRDDLLAEYITLTECSNVKPVPTWLRKLLTFGKGRAKGSFPNLPITNNARKNV